MIRRYTLVHQSKQKKPINKQFLFRLREQCRQKCSKLGWSNFVLTIIIIIHDGRKSPLPSSPSTINCYDNESFMNHINHSCDSFDSWLDTFV